MSRLNLPLAAAVAALSVACGLHFGITLYATRGPVVLTPDGAHQAIVARNLVRGNGYTVEVIPFHPGFFQSQRHLPEMHGLLQPVLLVPLFAIFGLDGSHVRIPGLLLSTLTGLVAFAFARRIFGVPAGLLALWLTLTSTSLFFYGRLGSDDLAFGFFTLSSLALLHATLARPCRRAYLLTGLAAGLALLAKPTGVLLPFVLVIPVLWFQRRAPRQALSGSALILVPLALALTIYVLRNYLAYGSPGFRFGALEWIWKIEGYAGMFAFFEAPPKLSEVVASLGWSGVLDVVGENAVKTARGLLSPGPLWPPDPIRNLMTPAFISPLGMLCLGFHLRRNSEFALIGLLSVVGLMAFVCLLYHPELRYFSPLIPLLAIALAGVVAAGSAPDRPCWSQTATISSGIAVAVLSTASFAQAVKHDVAREFSRLECPEATEWIRTHVPREAPVLTVDPWRVAWQTDRATVNVPSNGPEAIIRVARHYDTRWVFVKPAYWREATLRTLREVLAGSHAALEADLAFEYQHCQVYHVRLGGTDKVQPALRTGFSGRKQSSF